MSKKCETLPTTAIVMSDTPHCDNLPSLTHPTGHPKAPPGKSPRPPQMARHRTRPLTPLDRPSQKSSAKNANADESCMRSRNGTWMPTGPAQCSRRSTTCTLSFLTLRDISPSSHRHLDRSSPSFLPPRHYCDIMGLEVRIVLIVSFCDTLSMNRPRTPICARRPWCKITAANDCNDRWRCLAE